MSYSKIFSYIDREFPRFVEEFQKVCQQPSISKESRGIEEMVSLLRAKMEGIGIHVEVVNLPGSFPFIFGEIEGRSSTSVLFYNHYDVQPIDPIDEWVDDPFSASIKDGKIYARGAADDKGCLMSRIHAVEAWLENRGELPVTVKFLIEGEEEIGSPHIVEFVKKHHEKLKADVCVWEYSSKDEDGNPTARLGNKGMCAIEVESYGARADTHSMYAPVVPNPAWELTWALSTLKDREEKILVDGFYEDIEPVSSEEEEILNRLPFNEVRWKERTGLNQLIADLSSSKLVHRLYTEPTLNINGLASGFQGKGIKAIVPSKASAKVDIRLVPHQDPLDIFEKVEHHFRKSGFEQMDVRLVSYSYPSKTSVTSPIVDTVTASAALAYEQDMLIEPTSPGSGPRHAFHVIPKMPIVALGVGYMGSEIHAPNENVRLEDYREGTRHIAALIGTLIE